MDRLPIETERGSELASDRRAVLSWALYDWADSAFATTVMAGFFPLFLKEYWSAGADAAESTFRLGWANSAASLFVAIVAPFLGAIADRGTAKKRFLGFFLTLGVLASAGLALVGPGGWAPAILLYSLGCLGFSGGNVFYDALIVAVAPARKVDVVSALGYALGYLGGGILFALNVAFYLAPEAFGFADANAAVRTSFLTVALWWALFSVPLFLRVREPRAAGAVRGWAVVGAGFRQVRATFADVRALKVVFLFLAAYWLYMDGVDTVVRMAVDYGLSLGFPGNTLVAALLITQFVGFPAALAFGRIGERIGSKRGILVGIAVYVLILVWGARMREPWEFYALAVAIGCVQGGVQSLSRALYARIIPPSKAAEFFGFYNMLGKFAAVIGPTLMGTVGLLSGSVRAAILSIAVLFVAGAFLLARVDEDEGQRAARAMEGK